MSGRAGLNGKVDGTTGFIGEDSLYESIPARIRTFTSISTVARFMNRQPYGKPPRWWSPKLNPIWVRMSRAYRCRQLRVKQQLDEIQCDNIEKVQRLVAEGKGVLITPNHSAHYDSAALYVAADRIRQPLYFMAAWQVFAMSNRFERWAMQKMGCFSINREGNDRQAFKQATGILRGESHPLVIFPEGDIYHTTDHVTPFREGAVAIALSAARRGERPIVTVPCGIKFWYVDDPMKQLADLTARLEDRLYLRAWPGEPLAERIHRLAEAVLALKELDYVGHTRSGHLRERISFLTRWVLSGLEESLNIRASGETPLRVKTLRHHLIEALEETDGDTPRIQQLGEYMEDLFFVMQLYSYRGDYLLKSPSVERLAETLDKFEEDILQLDLPTVRGRRRVRIHFGEPIDIPAGRQPRERVVELTNQTQQCVQAIIDSMNNPG